MEDFILREIDKIGQLIRGMLRRFGVLKPGAEAEQACEATKIELLDKLGVDFDTLLDRGDFIALLVGTYGFNHDNLEQFAELLYDFTVAAEDAATKARFGAAACEIYKYLDAHKVTPSFNRYYILKELNNQN